QDLRQAIGTKLFQGGVFRFEDPVGCEQDRVARLQIQRDLFVLRVRIKSKRHSGDADGLYDAVTNQQWVRRAGVRERQLALPCVVDGKKRRDKAAVESSAVQTIVQHGQHFGGRTRVIDDVFANNSNRQ